MDRRNSARSWTALPTRRERLLASGRFRVREEARFTPLANGGPKAPAVSPAELGRFPNAQLAMAVSRSPVAHEDLLAVVGKELRVGLGQLIRKLNVLPLKGNEVLFQHRVRKIPPEVPAQDHRQFFIQRDKPCIKGGVVEAGKTQAVLRIQPLARKVPPRFNVAGDEQPRDRNPRDAATHSVGPENRLSEKLLPASDADRGFLLCRAAAKHRSGRPF